MKFVVQGQTYYVEMYGSGQPLLLLHGFTGSCQTWHPFISTWSQHMQCIAIDILGHGQTDAPSAVKRYNIEIVAKDIAMLFEQLEIKKAHILGYSMGGRLALTFAIRYPQYVQTLILESSSPGLKTEEERVKRREEDERLAQFIEKHGVVSFVDRWESIPLFSSLQRLPKSMQQTLREERLQHTAIGLANSLRGMGTGVQPSWWETLHQLHMPILLICGEDDEKFCRIASEMVQLLPNGTLITVPHAGHVVHMEQRERFGTLVQQFVLRGGLLHGN
ncbi:2-succinyl-6-hydroxy-2,4-cyclohexadiene-1-carboxylate synthase [Anoxybacillus flavithermus]|uniref:Putative 2-succinyl-6-hydroxy-2,4-cyclohexadiene-1-carboxylate synthase n=1 Tax=Anoxybacillus flavithermus TaxID=33934 RepID=A0A2G5RS84_9BACL|nr:MULTISPECIES: 2-succinyl-6-hydroxy-2,4-cyclohexadiene-1-carboxylate synthase [Anoxybacillus]KFZ42729.1 esterase [Anoxybacillus sp. KU2-6(11)]PIC05549.1 2-succinyl-6-hydroxy-2,4-cyclohexadiene-1-carboxylate synthase [Anoxybacillus flavithermus]